MGTRESLRAALIRLIPLALVLASAVPCVSQTAEDRTLWVSAWGPGIKNGAEVTALVNRAKSGNFNAIAAQVRKTGDAYYFPTRPNRDVRAGDIAADYDPLLDLCTQAHAQGIRVYAWVVAQRIASVAPPDPDHLMNRHPDWLTQTITGGTLFSGEGYYADPGNPGAAEWNYNTAMDLILHYPIDGLLFDYIRYPNQNSGYNAAALDRFRVRYGLGSAYVPNYTDSLWSAWRREQVTHFMRRVYANALETRPEIVIGASTYGDRNDAYTYRFQDWRSWMMSGIMDCNYPMIYTTSNTTFNTRIGDCVANGGARWTCVLQGSYLNTIANTMSQIGLARSAGAKGAGIYRYCYTHSGDTNSSADDEPTFYSTLTSQAFTQPVSPPAMPWKTSPTVGHLKGTIVDPVQGKGVDAAWIMIEPIGGGGYGTYSDGNGFYAYMNLAPGDYNISVSKDGFYATKPVTISAGSVSTVDFVASGVEAAGAGFAKLLPDGSGVALPPMTVTAGNTQLRNRFYIEDANHASGIAVELPSQTDVLVCPSDLVRVFGTVMTTADGERVIANPLVHTVEADHGAVTPVGVRGKDLAGTSAASAQAGADAAKAGILVEAVGKITAVDAASKAFYIEDGSLISDGSGATGLRVRYSGLADGNPFSPPPLNARVRVTGIVGIESITGAPHCTLIPREQNDVSIEPGTAVHSPVGAVSDGWNLISIPGTPWEPSPSSVFGGMTIDAALYQWDNRTQSLIGYDDWTPESFGRIFRGDGYWLVADSAHQLDVTVYGNTSSNFLIALPKAGWTLFGNPFDSERPWGSFLVTDGLEAKTLASAAQAGAWLNSIGYWWDSSVQSLYDIGLPEDFPSTEIMRPWHGYWLQTHVDDLSLIAR